MSNKQTIVIFKIDIFFLTHYFQYAIDLFPTWLRKYIVLLLYLKLWFSQPYFLCFMQDKSLSIPLSTLMFHMHQYYIVISNFKMSLTHYLHYNVLDLILKCTFKFVQTSGLYHLLFCVQYKLHNCILFLHKWCINLILFDIFSINLLIK